MPQTNSTMTAPSAESYEIASDDLRLLVDGVQDYAIYRLDPDGRVLTWNQGAQRMKGYLADEIIGKHFSVFLPPEGVERGKPARELKVVSHPSSVQQTRG